jgi:hypothetical protein
MSDSARPPATPPEPSPAGTPPAAPQAASLFQVVGAVFWSFFGVRKGRHMQQDAAAIKLHHVVLVGIALAAVFVFSLVALVSYITRTAP